MRMLYWMAAMAATGILMSCEKDKNDNPPPGTFYGTPVNIGNGAGRTFISHADDHERMQVGISFNAAALEGLPHNEAAFELDLPAEARDLTPFDHIGLDWTAHGHTGTVYALPHFDVHFYMITREERDQISPQKPEMAKLPDPSFIPPTYFNADTVGEPRMGRHWVDATSPELQPGGPPFTTTLVLGTYDAKVVFWEPMITRDFLLSKPDTVIPIPQPQAFRESDHYPTRYEIHFDEQQQQYTILFSGFEHR